ncbi:hypothetical protein V5O48_004203 [Marasmius crinis-equi]|uniref:Uncharacterized protein n=1 Tax=Marasmius crinis-equi TaxID=585013 RepID=A0ABR3FR26_9AGAR
MPCIRWDPSAALFYWSFDPEGKERISEVDWEKYGIPKLQVETWIGSSWLDFFYGTSQEYLRLKNYDIDGEQYALERGWPILLRWDPHNPDTGDWEQMDAEDEVAGRFEFASTSSYSLVEVPNEVCAHELDGKKGAGESAVARWMKGFFKRGDKSIAMKDQNADSDRWSVINEREGL